MAIELRAVQNCALFKVYEPSCDMPLSQALNFIEGQCGMKKGGWGSNEITFLTLI